MNNLVIIGRLTSDGTYNVRNFNGTEAAVYNNTVAVNTRKADGSERTEFFDIAAWRGLADVCKKYCRKGMMVGVKGEAGLNTYQANNGAFVARITVHNVSDIQFCDRYGQPIEAEPEAPAAPVQTAAAPVDSPATEDDDELPF